MSEKAEGKSRQRVEGRRVDVILMDIRISEPGTYAQNGSFQLAVKQEINTKTVNLNQE